MQSRVGTRNEALPNHSVRRTAQMTAIGGVVDLVVTHSPAFAVAVAAGRPVRLTTVVVELVAVAAGLAPLHLAVAALRARRPGPPRRGRRGRIRGTTAPGRRRAFASIIASHQTR